MSRLAHKLVCLALLGVGLQSAHGFALLGPKEAWQTAVNGYNRLQEINYPTAPWLAQEPDWTYAPKNLGEWYRWSTPTLYYTYDPSFLYYFKTEGVQAIDSAFAALNSISNLDAYSTDLSEFALDEGRYNYSAAALHLFDMKSAMMELLVTRLGLADPERWTWCIREKILPPGLACPQFDMTIIQRNFDPVTLTPSKFVNGNLFTYQYFWFCPPPFEREDMVEVLVDPLQTYNTAVASPKMTIPNILYYGFFHTGLTRDDVGGLRYLYSTNRLAVEVSPPDALLFNTNAATTLLVTSNLTLLANQALTNDAATLQGLYPNLVILGSTNYFTNVYITNLTAYFTNYPWDPAGTPAHLAFATNIVPTVESRYTHSFANVLTVANGPGGWVPVPLVTIPPPSSGWVTIQTTSVASSNNPWAPATSTNNILTNVTSITYRTNEVVGEYFLLPTNVCSLQILYSQLQFVNATTNNLVSATNSFITTNASGGIASGSVLSYAQDAVFYYTNHAFAVHLVTCDTNTIALRQGLQKISFVRHDYDSLFNRYFYPITNFYSMTAVTNNTPTIQRFQRIVTRPDIVIAGADLQTDIPVVHPVDIDNGIPTFNTNALALATAGPGTIEGPMTITFNKSGPVRLNSGPYLADEATAIMYYMWASFDGSTNAPVVYGDSTLTDLNDQLFITVSPNLIPAGVQFSDYSQQLSVTGGLPPYSWSVSPSSPALPPGMSFAQGADSSTAVLFGNPQATGTYVVILRVTDSGGRFVDSNYLLVINSQ